MRTVNEGDILLHKDTNLMYGVEAVLDDGAYRVSIKDDNMQITQSCIDPSNSADYDLFEKIKEGEEIVLIK